MSGFAKGMSTLFNGPDTSAQDAAIAKARDNTRIAADKQAQDVSAAAAEIDVAAGKASRAPRGRRLLMAATGEQGLPSTLGG